MAAGIEKKASAQEDAKPTAQRTVVQNVKQNWDCSQIENEEEEEDEDWKKETRWKGNGMRMKSWKRVKEVLWRQRSCKGYLTW